MSLNDTKTAMLQYRWARLVFRISLAAELALLLMTFQPAAPNAYAADQGIELFEQEQYAAAAKFFKSELQKRPDNGKSNYYLGRCQLILKENTKALVHLEKAVALAPRNADYRFWLGVAYWANLEFDKERRSYLEALKLDPHHVQAQVYLGHNAMDRNQWQMALKQYDSALAQAPDLAEALYNRALVLGRLGRTDMEKTAWRNYLRRYRRGLWSFRAVAHLNQEGDFSYRIYQLGLGRIIVPSLSFKPQSAVLKAESMPAVANIADALRKHPDLGLHIIAFVKDNPDLARDRAVRVKRSILETFPDIAPARLKTSWFGVPEEISSEGRIHVLDASVKLISMER